MSALRWSSGLLLLSACNIGESIVGFKGGQARDQVPCTAVAASCDSVINFVPLMPPTAPLLETLRCGDSGAACADGALASDCNADVAVSANGEAAGPRTFSCAEGHFTIAAGVAQLTMNQLTANDARLSFSAQSPVVIELVSPQLDTMHIDLTGPITLRISATKTFRDVLISDDSGEGQLGASVVVKDSTATRVGIVGVRGQASVERSTLDEVSIFASDIDLETITTSVLNVSSTTLSMTEMKGDTVSIECEHATVSASNFTNVQLQKCDTALFANVIVTGGRFGACTTLLRYDHGAINSALVAGPIESLQSSYDSDTFGANVPTSLISWQDTLTNNRFCAQVDKVTLGDLAATLVCNDCTATIPNPPQLFCAVSGSYSTDGIVMSGGLDINNPDCPVMTQAAECSPAPMNFNP